MNHKKLMAMSYMRNIITALFNHDYQDEEGPLEFGIALHIMALRPNGPISLN
jgi:hypothetical protein